MWPFAPVAERIARAVERYLEEHAPRTAASFDREATLAAVEEVKRSRADLEHDIAALRREALRQMLSSCDEDPALADPALAVALAERQRVEHYPDAAAALDRIAAKMPIVGLTNGNADPALTRVAPWLTDLVAAEQAGVAKPDARIFRLACDRLGLAPAEVMHAGDHVEIDVEGALAAGLQAAWVRRDHPGEPPPGALVVDDLLGLADALGA